MWAFLEKWVQVRAETSSLDSQVLAVPQEDTAGGVGLCTAI